MSSKNIKVLEELQEKVLPIDDAELSDDSEITKPKSIAKEKKPYDDIRPSEITVVFLNRLLNTLEYTYHMSKRDLIN